MTKAIKLSIFIPMFVHFQWPICNRYKYAMPRNLFSNIVSNLVVAFSSKNIFEKMKSIKKQAEIFTVAYLVGVAGGGRAVDGADNCRIAHGKAMILFPSSERVELHF